MTSEEDIKPRITLSEVKTIADRVYGLKEGSFLQLQGYDDLNYHCLPKNSDNQFVKTLWEYGYVLKIMNSLDSKRTDFVVAQNAMMFHLREHKITSPIPIQTVTGDYYVKVTFPLSGSQPKRAHIVRLLEFQPGLVLKKVQKSHSLLYNLGVFLGKLNEALKEFSHPFYDTHSSIWHLKSVPELKSMTEVVQNPGRKQLVDTVIEKFIQEVLSKAETFEKGMIHGDFNEHNVLISDGTNGELKVSAILDLGDSHRSYYLFELAVAVCYMMLECKEECLDPVIGAGHVIAGYLAIRSKFSVDFGLLKLCICARLCQSLVLGLKAFSQHPENAYVMDTQEKGWPLLEELWEISDEKITQDWNSVIEFYTSKHQEKHDS